MPTVRLAASWSSDNPEVATVGYYGGVMAHSVGTCMITATYGDITASLEITVLGTAGFDNISSVSETFTIFNINGILLKRHATQEDIDALAPGLYIISGKKVLIR